MASTKLQKTVYKAIEEVYDECSANGVSIDEINFANCVSQQLYDEHHINCADETSKAGDYLKEGIHIIKQQGFIFDE